MTETHPTQEVTMASEQDAAVEAVLPPAVFDLRDLEVHYGQFRAVREVNMVLRKHEITAFIGPSGCGKTTVLRCLNRMNDVIPSARVGGKVLYHGADLYGEGVSATEVALMRSMSRVTARSTGAKRGCATLVKRCSAELRAANKGCTLPVS